MRIPEIPPRCICPSCGLNVTACYYYLNGRVLFFPDKHNRPDGRPCNGHLLTTFERGAGVQSGIERVLIARGMFGTEVILATDGPWVASHIEENNDCCCDSIGDGWTDGKPAGLYLAEMSAEMSGSDGESPESWWYCHKITAVRPDELAELLAMKPTEGT